MDTSGEYEILDVDEFFQKTETKMFEKAKHCKNSSETISTNSCTFYLDKQNLNHSPLTKLSNRDQSPSKTFSKRLQDLPERLVCLKQITDNKVKFLRVEKEIKELKDCTFKPKINAKGSKPSFSHFSKQQTEYIKKKNSKLMNLKIQYSASNDRNITPILTSKTSSKKISTAVHQRLYEQSKILPKKSKLK